MSLKNLLAERQNEIAEKWLQAVNGTYPFNTVGFLRAQSDQFANPVGERNKIAAASFTAALLADEPDQEELAEATHEFVKVRAIQNFSPENAVGIILALKPIINEILGDKLVRHIAEHGLGDYALLERRIDAIALLAFGSYARCREKVAEMRIDEFKRGHSQIIRQAERALNREFAAHRLK